jgi:hypothetical protein
MPVAPTDRRSRRTRRDRTRRLKLGVAAVIGAASIAVLGATALGQTQEAPGPPKPKVDQVDLTPQPVPVEAGWEGQVGTAANLVAVQWNGDKDAKYTFEVRDGRGDWRRAAETQVFDNGPDQGSQDAVHGATPDTKHVTEPVWVGRNVTGIRVRLDDGSAQDVTLHVIDSTTGKKPDTNVESSGTPATPTTAPEPTTSAPTTSAPPPSGPASGGGSGGEGGSGTSTTTSTTQPAQQGLGLGPGLAAAALASLAIAFIVRRRRVLAIVIVAAVALVACAPTKQPAGSGRIVARSDWGGDLDWNWGACPGGPEYTYVSAAVVHHTVNSNFYGPGDSAGIIRGIYAYHVHSLGYCDIAYNFIVDNYGTVFEGRWGGMDQPVLGAHTLNYNRGTTGIAVLGTFSSEPPSGAAEGTLIDVIRWKFQIHGVNPFIDPSAGIYGHRDLFGTECPGQALYNDLPGIRYWVDAGW